MNSTVFEYYRKGKGHFSEVILLDDESNMPWEKVEKMSPDMPKGWFELCHLSEDDRISFICDYWQKMLPYSPKVHDFLTSFFARIDDVAVFLFQKKENSTFEAELVYSLKNEKFLRGSVPIGEGALFNLQKKFLSILPNDYLSFLRLHNGFGRSNDRGILSAENVKAVTDKMCAFIEESGKTVSSGNRVVNPKSLIFFYEDCGQNAFQCFLDEWYPAGDIGNVYFSTSDFSISDYKAFGLADRLAFPSFLDWLMVYLEDI